LGQHHYGLALSRFAIMIYISIC